MGIPQFEGTVQGADNAGASVGAKRGQLGRTRSLPASSHHFPARPGSVCNSSPVSSAHSRAVWS
jgi:hypothetical protein